MEDSVSRCASSVACVCARAVGSPRLFNTRRLSQEYANTDPLLADYRLDEQLGAVTRSSPLVVRVGAPLTRTRVNRRRCSCQSVSRHALVTQHVGCDQGWSLLQAAAATRKRKSWNKTALSTTPLGCGQDNTIARSRQGTGSVATRVDGVFSWFAERGARLETESGAVCERQAPPRTNAGAMLRFFLSSFSVGRGFGSFFLILFLFRSLRHRGWGQLLCADYYIIATSQHCAHLRVHRQRKSGMSGFDFFFCFLIL